MICNGRFPVSENTVWLGVFGEIPQTALVMKLDLGSAIKSDEPQIAKKKQESFQYAIHETDASNERSSSIST